jgi:hypothetical protein
MSLRVVAALLGDDEQDAWQEQAGRIIAALPLLCAVRPSRLNEVADVSFAVAAGFP